LLDLVDLVVIGDHLVGRSGLATIDELARAIRPGARASRTARGALDLIRVGAESAMETRVRLAVVDAGFPEPQLNIDVHDGAGVFLGRVDMAWPELRIALEYDGDHHRERETFHHDQRRRNGFEVNGWLVIHVTATDAARPAVMFERLRQAFALRAGGTRGQSIAERAVRAGPESRS
ncbi:MAG: endonuclease domain-containing protein, partial [Curtobacterium sp.]